MESALTGGSTKSVRCLVACSRSSAAPPRSRKRSSAAASACSLTRSSTKPVLPVFSHDVRQKVRTGSLAEIRAGHWGTLAATPRNRAVAPHCGSAELALRHDLIARPPSRAGQQCSVPILALPLAPVAANLVARLWRSSTKVQQPGWTTGTRRYVQGRERGRDQAVSRRSASLSSILHPYAEVPPMPWTGVQVWHELQHGRGLAVAGPATWRGRLARSSIRVFTWTTDLYRVQLWLRV
jgi:hypothetical protein